MKKIISVFLIAILMLSLLVGCGESVELYKDIDLKKFVTLEKTNYLGITVNTKSEEFDYYYDLELENDIAENDLYEELTCGTVQDGDTVNLDYSGSIDGVVFPGGTAQDQTLKIGSGSFIDDFEEELIGAKIGETREVTAKFPDTYQSDSSLAGKEAVFICKINGIVRSPGEDVLSEVMGFSSPEDYKADLKDRAIESYILDIVCSKAVFQTDPTDNSTVFPEDDSEIMLNAMFEQYVDMYKEYGHDLEEFLIQRGSTIEEFKENLRSELLPTMMKTSMVVYHIYEQEELDFDKEIFNSQDVEQEILKETYTVQEIVIDYLKEKAVIK